MRLFEKQHTTIQKAACDYSKGNMRVIEKRHASNRTWLAL